MTIAGCKDFTVALKMYGVFNEKQMYDSVIKGTILLKIGIVLYQCF